MANLRHQTGIADAWIALAGLVLLGLAAAWGWSEINAFAGRSDKAGYDRAMGEVAKRDNEQLVKVQAENKRLADAAAKTEADAKRKQADLVARMEKERREHDAIHAADAAAIAAGTLVLRDPGVGAACPASPSSSAPTKTAGPTGGGDEASGSQLSAKASGFLLDLAAEADGLAVQLSAAQEIIRADRALCNGGT